MRTRRWTWRQSENGKITSASTDIFFPIDGFTDFNRERVLAAQDELQMRIARIWGCKTIVGLVDSENPYMEFEEIIYVFLTIFLYLLKCPQSLIL